MSQMPTHSIRLVIHKGGKIEATVNGVNGPACSNISRWLDGIGKVEKDLHTEDYDKEPDMLTSVDSTTVLA